MYMDFTWLLALGVPTLVFLLFRRGGGTGARFISFLGGKGGSIPF